MFPGVHYIVYRRLKFRTLSPLIPPWIPVSHARSSVKHWRKTLQRDHVTSEIRIKPLRRDNCCLAKNLAPCCGVPMRFQNERRISDPCDCLADSQGVPRMSQTQGSLRRPRTVRRRALPRADYGLIVFRCKTCLQRQTPCIYRQLVRQRRKRSEIERDELLRQASGTKRLSQRRALSSVSNFSRSVSATHMASPSCEMQLYYGPTSYFSLMQHIYSDLVSHPAAYRGPTQEVEEASAGLDLFSFRRVFFGTPEKSEAVDASNRGDMSFTFLPDGLARFFLARFLSTLHQVIPYRTQADLEGSLDRLYSPVPDNHLDPSSQATVLISLAIASLGTEHFAWADILYERAKACLVPYDDVVNIQAVQISHMMISRPNAAFLLLETASRKAVAAGLHKEGSHNDTQSPEIIEARRITFWSLYVYETCVPFLSFSLVAPNLGNFDRWFCFHTGRPNSLFSKDISIELPRDPFVRLLAHLSKTISRSTDEIYGQCHESLLHMWRVARSIEKDTRSHEAQFQQVFGFGIDAEIKTGAIGVRQTVFTSLYYHTLLLTFRPFLMFRGHWQREMQVLTKKSTHGDPPHSETPSWLNEACNYAINAARKSIHHLSESSRVNELVRELRYHGYFMSSSAFTLIFDLMHDPSVANAHLPWIYASLHTMTTMRHGDPIMSSISAIQTTLRNINPSYEWVPPSRNNGQSYSQPEGISATESSQDTNYSAEMSLAADSLTEPTLSTPQLDVSDLQTPDLSLSAGSADDLFDFTQSGLGWDLDFSTMDLETFFSINEFSN
ncbi:hypothetical protein N7470_006934 [Penicillium chermesinum]|nr:hypothetical protein N7470_006934 [Penicillium chermesinum]